MLIHDFPCTRVVHHNRPAKYQALRGGPPHEPGHVHRPPSHTMPESSLRSFRANVIPHSGSTRALSCSRTALVGTRPGTDCIGPDSAFSHDAGCQRPGVRPRHSRRHAPHHPVGAFALTGTTSEGLRIACSDMAPMWLNHGPTARFTDLPFCNFRPKSVEPDLTSKCSQLRPDFPHFWPVSGSKRPPTCISATDANPCTRVKHRNRPQMRLRSASDGNSTALENCSLQCGCLGPRHDSPWELWLQIRGPSPYAKPFARPGCPGPKLLAPMYQTSRPPWQQRRP